VTEPLTVPALPPDVVAANRAAWVAALRGGRYARTEGTLRDERGFCCLGVAEDVRDPATWVDLRDPDDPLAGKTPDYGASDRRLVVRVSDAPRFEFGGTAHTETVLSGHATYWLGLVSESPTVTYLDPDDGWIARDLVDLNDTDHLPLDRIADVIEDQPADWDGSHGFAAREAQRRATTLEGSDEATEEAP
jgi:hypothetical protein